MGNTTEKFDLWCIVELFGHSKIAGHCTEQNIAGTNMLRVDVPAVEGSQAFTRFFGSAAIYAINPVDEQTARHMAERLQVRPIESWNISEILKKHNVKQIEAHTREELDHVFDDDSTGDYGTE